MDFRALQVVLAGIFHICRHVMERNFLHLEAGFFLKRSLPGETSPDRKKIPDWNYRTDMLDDSREPHCFKNGHFSPTGISFDSGNDLMRGHFF